MRLSHGLVLAALLAVACGDDDPEPDPAPVERPTPQQRPVPPPDTMPIDSPAAPDTVGDAAAADPQDAAGDPPGQEEPAAAGQRLYTVQVAAFTDRASADEWTRRLRSLDLPVWTSVAELGGRTFYRVRVGATPRLGEAQRLGTVLSERFDWPVWVAPVTPAERLPADAVEHTRRALGG